MKYILVTGGLGYIGSHICFLLLQQKYNVIIIDNLSNSKIDTLYNFELLTKKQPVFYDADLNNINEIEKIFESIYRHHEISHVIHLAGLKSVSDSIKLPIEYYRNNINTTLNLLEIMKKFNCKNIIFSSSATVYGSQPSPNNEQQQTGIGITNPYGRTKFMIEEILKDLYISDNSFCIIILRYFNPIGSHDSGYLDENPNNTPNNLFPIIINAFRDNKNELLIYGDDYDTQDGTCERDFIHVLDLAEAHLAVMTYTEGINIFNVGTGKSTSVMELITEFEKINGNINKKITGRRNGDLPQIYANCDKIFRMTNWRPVKTIKDALCITQQT